MQTAVRDVAWPSDFVVAVVAGVAAAAAAAVPAVSAVETSTAT